MARVLVVDDVALDRELACDILSADLGLVVETAADGAEAMQAIRREPPDLVVTDLFMPNMDGLELVDALRRSHPQIAAIIMTSKGSEELAARALQAGAASYVPKTELAQDLLENVTQVLSVRSQERERAKLLACMVSARAEYVLDNGGMLVPSLVKQLQAWVVRMGIGDEGDAMQVGVALQEALTNAMHHGNLEVDSKLRDPDLGVYHEAIRKRAMVPPYRDRRVYVTVSYSRTEAAFVIRDEGPGFDPTGLPDPRDPANLARVSGRGVLLMRAFMDEVRFNERGNEVTLVKRAKR
jgi:CheY-like chemotaxis protein